MRTQPARQFLLCCLFVLAFASSANSAKGSNLSPGENVIEEASPLLKGESKVEMKTLITPAAAEQSSSAPMTSAPAKKWELVGGYEPRKDAELTPEHIARYRDILTKLSPDDARGSKQHVELHSRGEGGGGGSAIRKEEDDDAQGGGQGDGSGSIPFPFLTLHQSHVALFVPSAT